MKKLPHLVLLLLLSSVTVTACGEDTKTPPATADSGAAEYAAPAEAKSESQTAPGGEEKKAESQPTQEGGEKKAESSAEDDCN